MVGICGSNCSETCHLTNKMALKAQLPLIRAAGWWNERGPAAAGDECKARAELNSPQSLASARASELMRKRGNKGANNAHPVR